VELRLLQQAPELSGARSLLALQQAPKLGTCCSVAAIPQHKEEEEGDAIAFFFFFFFSCNTKKNAYLGPTWVRLQPLQAPSSFQAPSSLPLQVGSKLQARSCSASLEPGALAME